MTPDEASRQMQRGVLTALMHIASVRDAGAAPLAIEFSAAFDEVTRSIGSASTPRELKETFKKGLPLALLKLMAQQHVPGDRRLKGLASDDLESVIDQRYRRQYKLLVIAAAEAALKVQIDKGPYRRRSPAHWELSALEEIKRVVQPDV